MGIVLAGSAVHRTGAVGYSQYQGAVSPSGTPVVAGRGLVPALDWTGGGVSEDDPELPDWVEDEYGGLHEGLENVEVVATVVEDVTVDDFDDLPEGFVLVPMEVAVEPIPTETVKRGPGRPKGSTNKKAKVG